MGAGRDRVRDRRAGIRQMDALTEALLNLAHLSMQELAGHIADGAMAFLKAEWRVLAIFVLITAVLLAYSGTIHEVGGRQIHSHWIISVAFIVGAVFSATAGYIGMKVATKANVRTTQAARTSLAKALKVSFTGGSVMGLGVAGLVEGQRDLALVHTFLAFPSPALPGSGSMGMISARYIKAPLN